jgi:hypothetical protein
VNQHSPVLHTECGTSRGRNSVSAPTTGGVTESTDSESVQSRRVEAQVVRRLPSAANAVAVCFLSLRLISNLLGEELVLQQKMFNVVVWQKGMDTWGRMNTLHCQNEQAPPHMMDCTCCC